MYEILKTICTSQAWPFIYATNEHGNLFNEVERALTPHVFLDPPSVDDIENDMGIIEQKIFSGNFMILMSSDIDEKDYETRFIKYMKPILDSSIITLKDSIRCNNQVTFSLWRVTEVVNVFDYNLDGLIVNYNITIDL